MSSTSSLRMSWDKMVSRTRKKRAGKGVAEAAASATSTSNAAEDLEDDATSAAAPPAPSPGAIKSAVDVTAIVASSSALEDDDEGVVYADAVDTMLHPDAHPDGGLALADKRLLDAQRAAVVELLKDFGRSLLLGRLDLMALSLPVRMFEPRSYLQKLTDAWTHPRFLEEASRPELAGNAEERVKLTATWFVAGLQHAFQSWRKPFNPILGETWAGRLPDGSEIFLEQTSHHPPVSAFQLVGPGGRYVFSGLSQPEVGFKGVDVRTTAKGARSIVFADDGLRIHVTFPSYLMRGVLGGGAPRGEMSGRATFVAPGAGIAAEVVFGKSTRPEHRGVPLLQRSDTITGSVYRLVGGNLENFEAAAEQQQQQQQQQQLEAAAAADAEDSDGGGGGDNSNDPFAAADAAAEARRRQQQQRRAGAGPASASTPAFLPSSRSASRRGLGGGGAPSSAAGLSLSSFASALNLAGNGGGGGAGGNSTSLAATPTAANNNAGVGCGNDPSTHAGGATRGETLATCSGNWLSHLDWDGKRAWTLAEEVTATWEPLTTSSEASPSQAPLPLPSDAGNRSDLRALAAAFDAVGDGGITADPAGVSAAQRAKEVLEVAQRADAKLRKEGRAQMAAAAAK